jgi:hypothetical protein
MAAVVTVGKKRKAKPDGKKKLKKFKTRRRDGDGMAADDMDIPEMPADDDGGSWRPVEVSQDDMWGCTEGGFLGLEELDASEYAPDIIDTKTGGRIVSGKVSTLSELDGPAAIAPGVAKVKKLRAAPAEAKGVCTFFLQGSCNQGSKCKMRHDQRAKAVFEAAGAGRTDKIEDPKVVKRREERKARKAAQKLKEEKGPNAKTRQKKRARERKRAEASAKAAGAVGTDVAAGTEMADAEVAPAEQGDPSWRPKWAAESDGPGEAGVAHESPKDEPVSQLQGQLATQDAAVGGAADTEAWLGLGVELRPEITAALRRLGFGKPTPIQAKALPLAITEDRDLIGGAQTGSGKTLAFGIPIMQVRAPAAAATCASSWALTAAVPRRRCWG